MEQYIKMTGLFRSRYFVLPLLKSEVPSRGMERSIMRAVWYLLAVFLFAAAIDRVTGSSYISCPAEFGSVNYVKVGCFQDKVNPSLRALKHLAFQDRDVKNTKTFSGQRIDWKNWSTYLPKFVCRCAASAIQNGQTYFGIQFYGECWIAKDKNDHYNRYMPSTNCKDTKFQTCQNDGNETCAGAQFTNYVYKITQEPDCVQSHQPRCSLKHRTVGCFKDVEEQRALPELLLTARDPASSVYFGEPIDWKNWANFIDRFTCECAKKAKENNYNYFGIEYFGECWSGSNADYYLHGKSDNCSMVKDNECAFEDCQEQNACATGSKICVGRQLSLYVYKLQPEHPDCVQSHQPQCQSKHSTVGCFKDKIKQRALPELLLTARDPGSKVYFGEPIDWYRWANFIDRFKCECAKRAKAKNYDYYGIEYFGECWSGSNYNLHGKSDNCLMVKDNECAFEDCHEKRNTTKTCVGRGLSLYVYKLQPEPIDGGFTDWVRQDCSKTCGCGERKLTRTCTNPAPQHGGKDCTGDYEKTESCNLGPCHPQKCSNNIDLAILLDASKSMSIPRFAQLKQFVLSLAENVGLSGTSRLGLITFNSQAHLRLAFDDTAKQNLTSLKEILDNEGLGKKTRIDLALEEANKLYEKPSQGNNAKVVILLTDGKYSPQVTDDYKPLLEPLKKKSVKIFAVGVGNKTDEGELLEIVSKYRQRLFMVQDFNYLFSYMADVVRGACQATDHVDAGYTEWKAESCSVTCGCGVRKLTRTCTDPTGCNRLSEKTESCNLGPCPPPPCFIAMDMAILLDASRSLEKFFPLFDVLKNFAFSLAENIDLSAGTSRLGLITFNSISRLRLAFDDTASQTLTHLKDILDQEHLDKQWGTRIDAALTKAYKQLFNKTANQDDKVKVVILLTDSKSVPKVDDYTSFVNPLKEKGVNIFAVGAGDDIRRDELLQIVSQNEQRLFLVHDFNYLFNYLTDVLRGACEASSDSEIGSGIGSGLGSGF